MTKKNINNVVIYRATSGAIELRGDKKGETVWASQAQIAEVFGVERSVVTKHIRNIFKDGELDENSVCANFAHTADDGKTYSVQFYNLDIVLGVGYRTNSKVAIEFRKWATKTLRDHITKGYTINQKQIAKHHDVLQHAINELQALAPAGIEGGHEATLELIRAYAKTWVSLDAYDRDALGVRSATKKTVKLTAIELSTAIDELKSELLKRGEASDLFAQERAIGAIEGIVGNVMQSFGGQSMYPSIEEKAAHLLYFIVKNHPFSDGNKRSGAFAFLWFLKRMKLKDMVHMTPSALTALTILVAESNSKDKGRVVALITQLL